MAVQLFGGEFVAEHCVEFGFTLLGRDDSHQVALTEHGVAVGHKNLAALTDAGKDNFLVELPRNLFYLLANHRVTCHAIAAARRLFGVAASGCGALFFIMRELNLFALQAHLVNFSVPGIKTRFPFDLGHIDVNLVERDLLKSRRL